jgi:hypothetical protein
MEVLLFFPSTVNSQESGLMWRQIIRIRENSQIDHSEDVHGIVASPFDAQYHYNTLLYQINNSIVL